MESDSLKSAIAAATIYNQQLDRRLSHTGIVDAALFHDFAAVQNDPNASSVGWLQAKLRVLSARVSSGASLSLHEPSRSTLVVVNTLEQFVAWADHHFPIAKVGP
ncbi:MAG: hypothetical protein WAO95_15870 [Burkholderiales bacterium]